MNLNLRVSNKPKTQYITKVPFRAVSHFLENDLFYYRGHKLELKRITSPIVKHYTWVLLRDDGVVFQGAHGSPVLTFYDKNEIAYIRNLAVSAIQPYRFKKEELNQKLDSEFAKFMFCAYEKDKFRVFFSHHKLFNSGEEYVTNPYTTEKRKEVHQYLPF